MSHKFQARSAKPDDAQMYFDWLKEASSINLVDTEVYGYPTCNTIVVEKDEEPILINSFHAVNMMEALAPKPGLSPKDEARALRELYDAVRRIAVFTGVREIWFACIDNRLKKFIEKQGFEQVMTPVYKIKVGGEKDPLNHERPVGIQKSDNI
jgi:hypothetical protein